MLKELIFGVKYKIFIQISHTTTQQKSSVNI
jgi:hypothetical protein